MTDLIDYLRDKLEHADDVVCTCPLIDTTTYFSPASEQRRQVRGYAPGCPIHGAAGPAPDVYAVRPNVADPEIWVATEPSRKHWWRR